MSAAWIHRMMMLAGTLFGLIVRGVEPSAWLAEVEGGTSLSRLLIPGSHDAGATRDGWAGLVRAKCQTATIREQLDLGVRFLDIRCRVVRGRLCVYHGPVDQRLPFEEVYSECLRFLREHPTECVLMSVKNEGGSDFSGIFNSLVGRHSEHWYTNEEVPRLKAVRGRLVLIRRFATETPQALGIDATAWPENCSFRISSAGAVRDVQDEFVVWSIRKKWALVDRHFDRSAMDRSEALYLNFASGCNWTRFWDFIRACSRRVNPRLAARFTQPGTNRPRGVVVMDFVTPKLSAAIYEANFTPGKRSSGQ